MLAILVSRKYESQRRAVSVSVAEEVGFCNAGIIVFFMVPVIFSLLQEYGSKLPIEADRSASYEGVLLFVKTLY